jgi:hypothetical protein
MVTLMATCARQVYESTTADQNGQGSGSGRFVARQTTGYAFVVCQNG